MEKNATRTGDGRTGGGGSGSGGPFFKAISVLPLIQFGLIFLPHML